MKFKYLFFLIFTFLFFHFITLRSYASGFGKTASLSWVNGSEENLTYWRRFDCQFYYLPSDRVCVYQNNGNSTSVNIISLDTVYPGSFSLQEYNLHNGSMVSSTTENINWTKVRYSSSLEYYYFSFSNVFSNFTSSNIPYFTNFDDVINYLINGSLPSLPFDESLELDYFKVSTYEEFFNSYAWDNVFKVGWTDSRISQVQVIISSTLRKDSFESSSSPFKSSFAGSTYAQSNGDGISLIATPYKADGTYGPSLYYSFVYNSNNPLTNVWRKNHTYNFQDNTIQIPYTGVSGNDTVEAPVTGIKQDTCYKIYYNPTTEEITNEYVYNVYYSPVIVYPENTSPEVIEQTQETVINNYTTNNYYTTTNQINYSFNIDFNDISANDVQQTYDDVGGFFNGLGSFISKLVSIFQLLFPFLPGGLAAFIIIAFGIIALFVVVALALKIAGVITNLLP